MAARMLLVAIDAADLGLLRRLSRQGATPNLDSLFSSAQQRAIHTPPGSTDDSLWASFQYALPLGEHGRYHWQRDIEGSDLFEWCADGEDALTSFWTKLSAQGKKVAIFDLPKTRLSSPEGGIHLQNWLVHGRYGEEVQSFPKELSCEVVDKFGAAPRSFCHEQRSTFTDDEISSITEYLLVSIQQKSKAAAHYLETSNWDLYATSFKELHCASHLLWHLIEDDDARLPANHPLLRIVEVLDAAIGVLLQCAGADGSVRVLSTSSMGKNHSIDHLAPGIVSRLNTKFAAPRWQSLLPPRMRKQISVLPYNENALALRLPGRLRQSHKIEQIANAVMSFRAGDTDSRVFQGWTNLPEKYPGSAAAKLPDLLFNLNETIDQPASAASTVLGDIQAHPGTIRSGNHSGGGFLLTLGSEQFPRSENEENATEIEMHQVSSALLELLVGQSTQR